MNLAFGALSWVCDWGTLLHQAPQASSSASLGWDIGVGNKNRQRTLPRHSAVSLFASSFDFPLGGSHLHRRISILALRTKWKRVCSSSCGPCEGHCGFLILTAGAETTRPPSFPPAATKTIPPPPRCRCREVCKDASLIPPTGWLQLFFSFIIIFHDQGEKQNCSRGFHKLYGGVCGEFTDHAGQKQRDKKMRLAAGRC